MNLEQFQDILLNYDIDDIPQNIRAQMDAMRDSSIEAAEIWETALLMEKAMKQAIEPQVSDEQIEKLHRRVMTAVQNEANEKQKQAKILFLPRRHFYSIISAAATLLFGIILGRYIPIVIDSPQPQMKMVHTNAESILDDFTISDIQIDVLNQDLGELSIEYTKVKKERIQGNISEPEIQKLLAYAMIREDNPGTRLRSVKLIQGNVNQASDDLQSALITTVKNDENQGIRLKAMKALGELPLTEEIKEACTYVIANDQSAAIRMEAIQVLTKDRSQETQEILNKATEEDESEGVQSLINQYYMNLQGSPLKK
jgi:hypothetical protein